MTITELAILPLTHALTKESSSLPVGVVKKLHTAKVVLEDKSGYSFKYFQQVEDPSIVYLLGAWESPTAHSAFLPSLDNQELLKLFNDDIIMDKMAMWHLDSNIFPISSSAEEKSVFTAPTISLNSHFVPKDKKAAFEAKFKEVRGLLEDFTKPYKVVGGWRIEKESEDKEEWVLFSGFESVDHHMAFAKTEEFEKYKSIVEFVQGFDLKHMRAINV